MEGGGVPGRYEHAYRFKVFFGTFPLKCHERELRENSESPKNSSESLQKSSEIPQKVFRKFKWFNKNVRSECAACQQDSWLY